jgi:hypothetical protein
MALLNDPRLYTGGSERINLQPHVALYAKLKEREQAKNEAFDEYIRNLNKNVNPAGMRNQEREVFEEKLKNWQQFGIQNREALRNPRKDNGMASMQFQAGYQDLMNLISESKTREEGKRPVIPLMLDPDKRDRMGEEFLTEISAHDAPLYVRGENGQWTRNPNSRTIDITRLNFEPKPFDQSKYFSEISTVKPSKSSQSVKDIPGLKEEITTTTTFSPEDYDKLSTIAVGRLASDKSFRPFLKTLNQADFNETFKKVYGRDIQNEGDLAAAYTIKLAEHTQTKTEVKDDKREQGLELERIRNKNRRALLELRNKLNKDNQKEVDTWVDAYVTSMRTEAAKPENRQQYTYKGGKKVYGYKVPLDPVLRKAIGLDLDETNGILIATDDGEYIIAPYQTNNNNKPKKVNGSYLIDSEKSSKISQSQLKLALSKIAAGVKQTNIEMLSDDVDDEEIGILD